jgi:hypothetical protein
MGDARNPEEGKFNAVLDAADKALNETSTVVMLATVLEKDVDQELSDTYVVRLWDHLGKVLHCLAVVHGDMPPRKILKDLLDGERIPEDDEFLADIEEKLEDLRRRADEQGLTP